MCQISPGKLISKPLRAKFMRDLLQATLKVSGHSLGMFIYAQQVAQPCIRVLSQGTGLCMVHTMERVLNRTCRAVEVICIYVVLADRKNNTRVISMCLPPLPPPNLFINTLDTQPARDECNITLTADTYTWHVQSSVLPEHGVVI